MMDKLGQKRTYRSKAWEATNPFGHALEGLHSGVAEVMEQMREVDEHARALAIESKDFVRSAKSYVRRHDYLSAALAMSEFHSRVRHISYYLTKFASSVSLKHPQFLLENFDPASREKLFGYDPNHDIKEACEAFEELTKHAGVLDWGRAVSDRVSDVASNIFTEKGRALKLFENQFSKDEVKALKTKTEHLVNQTSKMFNQLVDIFSELEKGLSRRSIRTYVSASKRFGVAFNIYHKVYDTYDKDVVQKFRDLQKSMDDAEKAEKDKILREQLAKQDMAKQQELLREQQEIEEAKRSPLVAPTHNVDESTINEEVPESVNLNELNRGIESEQTQSKLEQEQNKAKPSKKPLPPKFWTPEVLDQNPYSDVAKASNALLLNNLVVFAEQDNTADFVHTLIDYSEEIEDDSPQVSKQLLLVASDVMNEFRKNGQFNRQINLPSELPGLRDNDSMPNQELQRQPQQEEIKSQDLIDRIENKHRRQSIDLPNGMNIKIHKQYADIAFLSNITPNKMRITPNSDARFKLLFNKRIQKLLDINDADYLKYKIDIDSSILDLLTKAIYDGGVISTSDAHDSNHPHDKVIKILTDDIMLSELNNNLSGTVSLYVNARLSAYRGTLTIINIDGNFYIDGLDSDE